MDKNNNTDTLEHQIHRGITTKRPRNVHTRNMKHLFRMSWSQRGHDIYLIFIRTSSQLNLEEFDVALTDNSCTIQSPGMEKHGWIFFLEVNAKDAQRIQNDERLIIVIPKKDPTLCWPALKKSMDIPEFKQCDSPSSGSDAPPPEKMCHQDNEKEHFSVGNGSKDLSEPDSCSVNITMATGTMVTNGLLKGGNRPQISTHANSPNCSPDHNSMKSIQNSSCRHLSSVKNSWYESGSEVVVFTLYVPHLDPWGVNVTYTEDEIQISFKTADEKFHNQHDTLPETSFVWSVKLNEKIIPERCSHRVTLKIMELRLSKKVPRKWNHFFHQDTASSGIKESQQSTADKRLSSGDISSDSDVKSSSSTSGKLPSVKGESPSRVWNKPSSSSQRFYSSVKPGCTGLNNIGNTCFMNSVLQLLANTRELKEYFLGNKYLDDLNEDNPLGMNGKMAEEFASIIRKLWAGSSHCFSPVTFRLTVGVKEPRFIDFMQHDAQEFMAFLLDCLHEDLNRIKKKPYYEVPEVDNRGDHVVAQESWMLHTSRNDSFIVDLFHGMFKSKLICPTCKKSSTKFDPFLFLSVPLPKATRGISVIFHYKEPKRDPIELKVNIPRTGGRILDILSQVAKLTNCPVSRLRMIEVNNHRIYRFFIPSASSDKLREDDVLFIQETLSEENAKEPVFEVAVLQRITMPEIDSTACSYCKESQIKIKRCTKCLRIGYCSQKCQRLDWPLHQKACRRVHEFVGCPFITSIPQSSATVSTIKQLLFQRASSSVEVECFSEDEDQDLVDLFEVNPILWNGDIDIGLPGLQEFGDETLDLSRYKILSIDWQTDARLSMYVKIRSKQPKYVLSQSTPSPASFNLYDCIQLFTEPEVLAPQEAWYCPSCKEHKQATKELSLWKLPDVLIVQLKRFSFKNYLWRDKIDMFIDYPVNGLDLTDYCINKNTDDSLIYDLFGVVNHRGGICGGHYTSFVRLPHLDDTTQSDVGWRMCDDSNVMGISSAEQVVTKEAYVMFYRRRKCKEVASTPIDLSKEMTKVEDPPNGDHLNNSSKNTPQSSSNSEESAPASSAQKKKDSNAYLKTKVFTPTVLYNAGTSDARPSHSDSHHVDTSELPYERNVTTSAIGSPQSEYQRVLITNCDDNKASMSNDFDSPRSRQSDDVFNQSVSMDCVLDQPLVKYEEVFGSDEEPEDRVGQSSNSGLFARESPDDVVKSPIKDASPEYSKSGMPTELPYTDMDAVD